MDWLKQRFVTDFDAKVAPLHHLIVTLICGYDLVNAHSHAPTKCIRKEANIKPQK